MRKPSPTSLWARGDEPVSRSPANDMTSERTFPLQPGEDLDALQREFAGAYLRNPRKPAEAAYVVFPGAANAGRALQAANTWPNDAAVKKLMADLVAEHGAEHFLPTKEEVAMELLAMSRDTEQLGTVRLGAYKLYLEARGELARDAAPADGAAGLQDLLAQISAGGRPKPAAAE